MVILNTESREKGGKSYNNREKRQLVDQIHFVLILEIKKKAKASSTIYIRV